MNYHQAKKANEIIKVEKCKHQLKTLKESVIDPSEVLTCVEQILDQERKNWASWPDRIADHLAQSLSIEKTKLLPLLKNSIDNQLIELANIDIRLD